MGVLVTCKNEEYDIAEMVIKFDGWAREMLGALRYNRYNNVD